MCTRTYDIGSDIISKAREYVGKGRYVKQARTEDFPRRVDCTSLVVVVHQQVCNITLSRTIKDQLDCGYPIQLKHIKPGDVIITNGLNGDGSMHEVVYLGDDKIIHAIPGKGITTDTIEFCIEREIIAIRRFW